ncbi:MAG TPA: DUF4192 domain-containing protein [Mycobacteriales bacterium]|nr:DUF4192 domain-containing protein [Mycobacteriales bacterium]
MTESTVDAPVAHIRSPADLIESIPYLLGFHPVDSVVLAQLREGRGKLGSIVRADLPSVAEAGPLAVQLAIQCAGRGGDGAVILIYGSADDTPDIKRDVGLVELIGALLHMVGVQLCDAMSVAAGRWRSYFCTDPECCPAEGSPVAAKPGSDVAATGAIAGIAPFPDRQALVRSLELPGSWVAGPMTVALRHAETASVLAARRPSTAAAWQAGTHERFRQAVRRARGGGRPRVRPALTDQQAARLLVGLVDIRARDACWQDLDLHCSAEALAVCWQLAQRSLPPYRSAPLLLLGWVAWRRGDGALARVAAERALKDDPGYEAARLLLVAIDRGLHPDQLPRLVSRRAHPGHRRRR